MHWSLHVYIWLGALGVLSIVGSVCFFIGIGKHRRDVNLVGFAALCFLFATLCAVVAGAIQWEALVQFDPPR